MAAVEINFQLTPFLLNILRAIRARAGAGGVLEGVQVIKMFPLNDLEIDDLPLPSILVDLYEVEPDPDCDLGTGQLGVQLMFQAYVVVGSTAQGASLTVRKLALALGAVINDGNRFDTPGVSPSIVTDIIGMPKITGQRQYLVWSVEWQHATTIGAEDMLCDDPPVDADEIDLVMLGFDPDVGPGHEDDYETVIDDS